MVLKTSEILFRCSSMGDIMSGTKKGWPVDESLTCKRKLLMIYREMFWKRKKDKPNKYTNKGTQVEPDAITLYSRVKKQFYKKNVLRLSNDFFTGEVDLFTGSDLEKTKHTIDIKSSWDWSTFPTFLDSVDEDYDYQGQGYMDLTGAEKHTIAYCLVNTPAEIILDEKKYLARQMGIIDIETPDYIEKCIEIEKNHIVDMGLFLSHYPWFEFHCNNWDFDIPMEERVFEITINRDDKKIQAMTNRVIECRAWLAKKFPYKIFDDRNFKEVADAVIS